MISSLIRLELSHINTSHPDFIGGSKAVAAAMDKVNEPGTGSVDTTSTPWRVVCGTAHG